MDEQSEARIVESIERSLSGAVCLFGKNRPYCKAHLVASVIRWARHIDSQCRVMSEHCDCQSGARGGARAVIDHARVPRMNGLPPG